MGEMFLSAAFCGHFLCFSQITHFFLIFSLKYQTFWPPAAARGGTIVNDFFGRGGSTFLDVRGGVGLFPPVPPLAQVWSPLLRRDATDRAPLLLPLCRRVYYVCPLLIFSLAYSLSHSRWVFFWVADMVWREGGE